MSTETRSQLNPEPSTNASGTPTNRPSISIIVATGLALAIVAGVASFAIRGSTDRPNLLTNGDFETGDLAGWTVESLGHSGIYWGGWFVYQDGLEPPTDNDRKYSYNVFEVSDPPQGRHAAVTDGNGEGVHVLYRDINVDGPSLLRATVFYRTEFSPSYAIAGSRIIAPDDLTTSLVNQQYRIDLVDPEAPLLSVDEGDVLQTVFRTLKDDPVRLEPTAVSIDLSPWQGQTIRLRCVEVDTRGSFFAGIDDVRVERL